MFLHGLNWFEIESNIVFTGNCIDRESCLPILLRIILSSVKIVPTSASLYYGSVKELWTETVEGEKLLFQLQIWDLVCHCFLWRLAASGKQSNHDGAARATFLRLLMLQQLLLPGRGLLASNRPVLVCVGKAFQKPPTPGVLQACRMNCDCCITTIKKKYLITLTAAQSGRTVTEIFPLWMCSERPFVTSLLLIVLVSKVAGLLPFTFSSWSIGDI